MTVWRLNGQTIPEPSGLGMVDSKIARTDTTASGKKVTDIIAYKLRIELTFETLSAVEMAVLAAAYHATEPFAFVFPYLGESKTVYVTVGEDFEHEMLYASPEAWKNVRIVLDEV
jgi:hypothetical protein